MKEFARVSVAVPRVVVSGYSENAKETIDLIKMAHAQVL